MIESFFLGREAHNLTEIELNKVKDEARARSKAFFDLPEKDQMQHAILHAYEKLSKAIKLTQRNVYDPTFSDHTPDRERLLECFGFISQALMMLGNHVRNDAPQRNEINERVKEWWKDHKFNWKPENE